MKTTNNINYKLKDFAELFDLYVNTLQRWGRGGTRKTNTYDQYRNLCQSFSKKSKE